MSFDCTYLEYEQNISEILELYFVHSKKIQIN